MEAAGARGMALALLLAAVMPWSLVGLAQADAHFTGAHGVRFDFNGELDKSFCLTTDERIQINALLKGYKDGSAVRTWIRELAVLWKDGAGKGHSLRLVARGGGQQARDTGFLEKAAYDGKPVTAPAGAGDTLRKGELALTFLGTFRKGAQEQDRYRIRVGSLLDLRVSLRVANARFQRSNDAQVHFNLLFHRLQTTERVHGVLGQTYRDTPAQVAKAIKFAQVNELLQGPIQADGRSGKGFLEGTVRDYMTSALTKPDCKFSAF